MCPSHRLVGEVPRLLEVVRVLDVRERSRPDDPVHHSRDEVVDVLEIPAVGRFPGSLVVPAVFVFVFATHSG